MLNAPKVWTEIVQTLLGTAGLARVGNKLGLGDVIITAPGHIGRPSENMVATTFTALMGAVYLDGGESALERVIDHVGLSQVTFIMGFFPIT